MPLSGSVRSRPRRTCRCIFQLAPIERGSSSGKGFASPAERYRPSAGPRRAALYDRRLSDPDNYRPYYSRLSAQTVINYRAEGFCMRWRKEDRSGIGKSVDVIKKTGGILTSAGNSCKQQRKAETDGVVVRPNEAIVY